VSTEALADPPNTKTIRVQNGVPVVTDGPLAEAKEHFGGYLGVGCESIERATEVAVRWPHARYCPLEVRPIMDPEGADGPGPRPESTRCCARSRGGCRAPLHGRTTASTHARTRSRRLSWRPRPAGPPRVSRSTRTPG